VLFVLLITTFTLHVSAIGPNGKNKVLLVLSKAEDQSDFGVLIKSLRDKKYDVTVTAATDKDTKLLVDGEYIYDAVILLTPESDVYGKGVTPSVLLDFVDQGGSVFVAADRKYSAATKKLVAGLGIQLDDLGTAVIDHGTSVPLLDDGSHTWVAAGGHTTSPAILGATKSSGTVIALDGPIVFHGIGATMFDGNELVDPVLWGSDTCYSAVPDSVLSEVPLVTGKSVVLGAVLQARNGARGAYLGSVSMLKDSVLKDGAKYKAHIQFVTSLVAWTCGEYGVLRVENLRHQHSVTKEQMDTYKIMDEIEVFVDVSEWDGGNGHWVAYISEDMQLEFTMLNPYIRTRLTSYIDKHNLHTSVYTAKLLIPNVIGIYKFVIEYVRTGYSFVYVMENVNVRPFGHNEYERFLPQAFPYYISAVLMIVNVVGFGLVVLYGRPTIEMESKNQ